MAYWPFSVVQVSPILMRLTTISLVLDTRTDSIEVLRGVRIVIVTLAGNVFAGRAEI
jgi:hypothetical protein